MRLGVAFGVAVAAFLFANAPASALPVFAHRYGLTCQACHTTIPQLNAFGENFREYGFKLPGARSTFPAAVKVNLAYSSDKDATGLPKAVVDEVELLSGGTIGNNTSYWIEQYAVDGGRPGLTRDAWLQFNTESTHLKLGQFSLPLPVDVESERATAAHYALYDQTVGVNTFSFFEPRIGADASYVNEDAKVEAHLALLHAYDRQTETPRSGLDVMASLAKTAGAFTLQTYRYQGQRHFNVADRFWRQGYAASFVRNKVTLTGLMQTGNDSSADGDGAPAHSSGGFIEAGYAFTPAFQTVARYEGTFDEFAGMQRQFVLSAITRPRRNMRFTVEGTQSGNHRTLTTALLFAY